MKKFLIGLALVPVLGFSRPVDLEVTQEQLDELLLYAEDLGIHDIKVSETSKPIVFISEEDMKKLCPSHDYFQEFSNIFPNIEDVDNFLTCVEGGLI
jgi:hypothetical protein